MEAEIGDVSCFIQHICTFCQFTTSSLPSLVKHIQDEHLPQDASNMSSAETTSNIKSELDLQRTGNVSVTAVHERAIEKDTVNDDSPYPQYQELCENENSGVGFTEENEITETEGETCDNGSTSNQILSSLEEYHDGDKVNRRGETQNIKNKIKDDSKTPDFVLHLYDNDCGLIDRNQDFKSNKCNQKKEELEHDQDQSPEQSNIDGGHLDTLEKDYSPRPKRKRKPNSLYENYEVKKMVKKKLSKRKDKEKDKSDNSVQNHGSEKSPPEFPLMQKSDCEDESNITCESPESKDDVPSKKESPKSKGDVPSKKEKKKAKNSKESSNEDGNISHIQEARLRACMCVFCHEKFPTVSDVFKHYHTVHDYYYESKRTKDNSIESEIPSISTVDENETSNGDLLKQTECDDIKNTYSKSKNKACGLIRCPHCAKKFQKDNLETHIHLKHIWKSILRKDNQKGSHACEYCGKIFSYKRNLKVHIEVKHLKTRKPRVIDNTVKKTFICEQCGYTTPENRRLKMHVLSVHQGIYPYICDQCDFRTHERSSFRDHKLRHAPEKPYKCELCSYQCIQRGSLRYHSLHQHGIQIPSKSINVSNKKVTKSKNKVNKVNLNPAQDESVETMHGVVDNDVVQCENNKNSESIIRLLNELPLNQKQVVQIEPSYPAVNNGSDQVTFIQSDLMPDFSNNNNEQQEQVVYFINVYDEEQEEVIHEIQPVLNLQENQGITNQQMMKVAESQDTAGRTIATSSGVEETAGHAEIQAATALVQYAMFGSSFFSTEETIPAAYNETLTTQYHQG